jgi:dTDP-4-dehydrorhamnose reductase
MGGAEEIVEAYAGPRHQLFSGKMQSCLASSAQPAHPSRSSAMTHLLVLGANGQVGRALVRLAGATRIACRALGRHECDIVDRSSVQAAIDGSKVVVNCAAYTAVDKAEAEAELAHRINAVGAGNVAASCARAGIPLIHLSTDYVFDGQLARPAGEDDAVNPINVYGHSKLAGEIAIREQLEKHIILRTSRVFSPWGQNFVKTMLRLATLQPEIRVVDDQIGGPTAASDIAEAILSIMSGRNKSEWVDSGTYNFSGGPAVSWFQFARVILQNTGVTLWPISTEEYPTPARRPHYSVLDCTRIGQVFGITPPDWRPSLRKVCDELIAAFEEDSNRFRQRGPSN